MQSTFSYDALGRMQTRTEADLTVGYAYDGLYNIDTGMVEYAPKPADASVGTVDMAGYLDWLRGNGYTMGNLRVQ
jgi:hypothetical protein